MGSGEIPNELGDSCEEEKTKNFFGVSPSQKRLNDFQLYSVLVSCLEDSWSSEW